MTKKSCGTTFHTVPVPAGHGERRLRRGMDGKCTAPTAPEFFTHHRTDRVAQRHHTIFGEVADDESKAVVDKLDAVATDRSDARSKRWESLRIEVVKYHQQYTGLGEASFLDHTPIVGLKNPDSMIGGVVREARLPSSSHHASHIALLIQRREPPVSFANGVRLNPGTGDAIHVEYAFDLAYGRSRMLRCCGSAISKLNDWSSTIPYRWEIEPEMMFTP